MGEGGIRREERAVKATHGNAKVIYVSIKMNTVNMRYSEFTTYKNPHKNLLPFLACLNPIFQKNGYTLTICFLPVCAVPVEDASFSLFPQLLLLSFFSVVLDTSSLSPFGFFSPSPHSFLRMKKLTNPVQQSVAPQAT